MKPIYGITSPRASNFLSLVESQSRYQITQSTSLELDCKTVRIFAYSRTGEQSNKRSGTRLKTPYGRVRLARFARASLLRHALPISLLILRKKPFVLQSTLEQERDQKKRRALGTTELENAQRCSPLRIHCAYLGSSFVCSLFRGIVVPLLDLCASTKVRKTSFGHMKLQQIGIYRYCLLETRKSCLIQGCSQPIINLQDEVYEVLV